MNAIDDLLNRNRIAAMSHPYWIGPIPTLHVAMVACMDTRVDTYRAFGIDAGEVHLIRNAGGVVTDDVIRSLAISQHALGTREVMVVHHTDCGLATLDEDSFRAHLAWFAGFRPTWSVQAFKDPHDSVGESLLRLRNSPFLLDTAAIRGFIFDVESGLLEEVTATRRSTPAIDRADPGRPRPVTQVLDVGPVIAFFDDNGRDLPWRRPVRHLGGAGQRSDAAADAGGQGVARLPALARALAGPADLAADSACASGAGLGSAGLSPPGAAAACRGDGHRRRPRRRCARDPDVLRTLPGIGEYTARAVAAFAFGARIPVVDVNVHRVVSRAVRGVDDRTRPPPRTAALDDLLPDDAARPRDSRRR